MGNLAKEPLKIGTYKQEDVTFLLKDLSSFRLEDSTENREKQMQEGGSL